MAVPIVGDFQNLVGTSSGSAGTNAAGLTAAGKSTATGVLGKAALSHCDGGLSGAKILSIAGGPFWGAKGFSVGGFGLGLGLGAWGPILAFGAGAAAFYGYSNFLEQKAKLLRSRAKPLKGMDYVRLLFGVAPPPLPRRRRKPAQRKQSPLSVLGFPLGR